MGRPIGVRGSETRERIIAAAREVFGEVGYEGATTGEIARRASVTRPALRCYFPSKRAVYDGVLDGASADIAAAVAAAARETTLLEQLTAFMAMIVSDRRRATFFATVVLDSYRHPDLKNRHCAPREDALAFLTAAVGDAVARGELADDTDTAAVVEMLYAVMVGASLHGGFADAEIEHTAAVERLRRLLSGGFGG